MVYEVETIDDGGKVAMLTVRAASPDHAKHEVLGKGLVVGDVRRIDPPITRKAIFFIALVSFVVGVLAGYMLFEANLRYDHRLNARLKGLYS